MCTIPPRDDDTLRDFIFDSAITVLAPHSPDLMARVVATDDVLAYRALHGSDEELLGVPS